MKRTPEPASPPARPTFLTLAQVAARLGIPLSTIWKRSWRQEMRLPAVMIGRRRYYVSEDDPRPVDRAEEAERRR
jgi:hypothetical protein